MVSKKHFLKAFPSDDYAEFEKVQAYCTVGAR